MTALSPETPPSPDTPPEAPATGETANSSPPAALAQPETSAFELQLRPLPLGAPLRWLAAGWRDFERCPGSGLFYGACFMAMGCLLMAVFEHAPAYVLALSAGFLLTGPTVPTAATRSPQARVGGLPASGPAPCLTCPPRCTPGCPPAWVWV